MSRASNLAGFSTSVVGTSPNNLIVGVVTAASFVGDGSGLTNAGSTLSAGSGSQRLVLTSLTSGTMTTAATDADLTWNSTTNTLSATNVSIAGTLTYEDVTNVDSIGIITARSGVVLTSGNVTLGTGVTISGQTSNTFTVLTNGSERVRVDSSGRFGLGTNAPGSKLTIDIGGRADPSATGSTTQSNAAFQIAATSETNTKFFAGINASSRGWVQVQNSSDNGTSDILLNPIGGSVGIATLTPSEKLHVVGNILASGNVTGYSDETLKDNVQTISDALDKVTQLRGVEFDRNDMEGNPHQIGVIAQEVEKIIPEVVTTHEDGIKSVAYGNLVGLLIEAIKDLKEEVNELKARLEEV